MARRPIGGGHEMVVPEAAVPTFSHYDGLAFFGQIVQDGFFIFIQNLGAHGNFHDQVFAVGSMAISAHTMLALFGLEML